MCAAPSWKIAPGTFNLGGMVCALIIVLEKSRLFNSSEEKVFTNQILSCKNYIFMKNSYKEKFT